MTQGLHKSNACKVYFNDGIRNFKKTPDDPNIERLGLKLGRIETPYEAYCRKLAEETRLKRENEPKVRTLYFNDGENEYRLKENDPKALEGEFKRGRIKKGDRKWYTDGIRSYVLNSDDKRITDLKLIEGIAKIDLEKRGNYTVYNDGKRKYYLKDDDPLILDLNLKCGGPKQPKTSSSKWYNDGYKNYRLQPDDPRTEDFNLGKLPHWYKPSNT